MNLKRSEHYLSKGIYIKQSMQSDCVESENMPNGKEWGESALSSNTINY